MAKDGVFFILGDTGGSAALRVITPAAHLKQRGNFEVAVDVQENDFLNEANIVVIQRKRKEAGAARVQTLREAGRRMVYEIDDNIWSLPYYNQHTKIWTPESVWAAEKIISACNAVTVSTEPLADVVRKFNKNVTVLPNSIEFHDWMDNDVPTNDKVRIGWAGGHDHSSDLAVCSAALMEVANKYPDKVQLVFMGMMPDEFMGIAEHYPFVPYKYYIKELHNLGIDIGVLPLTENAFNMSKSNVKYLEYSALHAASIASPIYPYSTTIKHCENGLIVKKNRHLEWVKALSMLIEDADMRRGLAENANGFVRENFDIAKNVQIWEDFYWGL